MKLENPLNLNFNQPDKKAAAHALPAGPHNPNEEIDQLKKELQAKSQQIETKNQEIAELKIKNRQLQEENHETQERQKLMDEELRKAEAQIELIMELMNENQEQQ